MLVTLTILRKLGVCGSDRRTTYWAVVAVSLLLGGCMWPTMPQANFAVADLLLQRGEVPREWVELEPHRLMPDVPELTVWYSGFGAPDYLNTSVAIEQQVTEFATIDEAKTHYSVWEASLFPIETWQAPENYEFAPVSEADLFRFGCLPASRTQSAQLTCRLLQQHHTIVSIVRANIDGSDLTLAQLSAILTNLDAKLAAFTPSGATATR